MKKTSCLGKKAKLVEKSNQIRNNMTMLLELGMCAKFRDNSVGVSWSKTDLKILLYITMVGHEFGRGPAKF